MLTTRICAAAFVSLLLTLIQSGVIHAHGLGPWGQALDWHNGQIDQVLSAWGRGQKLSIAGKECLAGGSLSFKVNDEYAFDIDETVWLNVEFYLCSSKSRR